MKKGNLYVPVFRDGLPMLVQFRELMRNDEVMQEGMDGEVCVNSENAEFSQGVWFFHDKYHNAYFPDDFLHYQRPAIYGGEDAKTDKEISAINMILAKADQDTAISALEKQGYGEKLLRRFGFWFVFDILPIRPSTQPTDVTGSKFPVNIAEIVPGKQIIVEPAFRNHLPPYTYMEGTVETVGRKYFYVRCKNYSFTLKFALASGRCESEYGIEYYAYPNLEVFRQEKERLVMARAIQEHFNRLEVPPYAVVREIYNCLDLPPVATDIRKNAKQQPPRFIPGRNRKGERLNE